jgi:hypothetical protein
MVSRQGPSCMRGCVKNYLLDLGQNWGMGVLGESGHNLTL